MAHVSVASSYAALRTTGSYSGIYTGSAGKEDGAETEMHAARDGSNTNQFKSDPAGSTYLGAAGKASGAHYEVPGRASSSPYTLTAPFANHSPEWRQSTSHYPGPQQGPRTNHLTTGDHFQHSLPVKAPISQTPPTTSNDMPVAGS
eukprot:gnl/MRDRNA2_/MRDRNA2_32927_c0_seq1.p1 gnl/MRDRNA2_/MRDRNA2_32927_c0~~gnl/MRDRNA2_/MRDRNA2_32927_c0_seq1.p1  ORF type:complete len:146 (+),score=14.72 gnl/MRDRNA2_/MRDRNA2_32927_c0_seq1:109-546(+)